jgi:NitT/TauT family transport system substrate-binding protein
MSSGNHLVKPNSGRQAQTVTRRNFLTHASALGLATYLGCNRAALAEPPPEVTRIRINKTPAICLAPMFVAEELLRLEGFTDVAYVEEPTTENYWMLLDDRADFTTATPPDLLPTLDAGRRVVALAGLHGGCYELFGNVRVHSIRDLKGKRFALSTPQAVEYYYVSSMLGYLGMDPKKDVEWVDAKTFDGAMVQFLDGKVDAFLAFPPQPQKVRAKKVGHVIVNTSQDPPWSQQFCCMVAARPQFVNEHPVATKRAVRAFIKAADICAQDPDRAARLLVSKGYEPSQEIALDVLKSLSYNRWRTHNAEDSLRFFGLRLREAGLIKSDPNKLIAQGTDWRFLNELKRELKA